RHQGVADDEGQHQSVVLVGSQTRFSNSARTFAGLVGLPSLHQSRYSQNVQLSLNLPSISTSLTPSTPSASAFAIRRRWRFASITAPLCHIGSSSRFGVT